MSHKLRHVTLEFAELEEFIDHRMSRTNKMKLSFSLKSSFRDNVIDTGEKKKSSPERRTRKIINISIANATKYIIVTSARVRYFSIPIKLITKVENFIEATGLEN